MRLILPAHDDSIFEGRVVILTDAGTASAMLSGESFPMDETFRLFLPVADYVTPDGVRLDRRGVAPDIEVPAEQALERALAEIDALQGQRAIIRPSG